MSSGCGDVLSLEDLKTAKKHQTFEAEVITGRAGGVSGGAEIDTAANPVTGQVQKTMPAILRDIGFSAASFDFTTGGTLTVADRDVVVYNPADNNWYSWSGTLPHAVAAGTDPTADSNWKPRTDQLLRQELSDKDGAKLIGRVEYFDDLADVSITSAGERIDLAQYAEYTPYGAGFFVSRAGAAPRVDGYVMPVNENFYWEREATDVRLSLAGARLTARDNVVNMSGGIYDMSDKVQGLINYALDRHVDLHFDVYDSGPSNGFKTRMMYISKGLIFTKNIVGGIGFIQVGLRAIRGFYDFILNTNQFTPIATADGDYALTNLCASFDTTNGGLDYGSVNTSMFIESGMVTAVGPKTELNGQVHMIMGSKTGFIASYGFGLTGTKFAVCYDSEITAGAYNSGGISDFALDVTSWPAATGESNDESNGNTIHRLITHNCVEKSWRVAGTKNNLKLVHDEGVLSTVAAPPTPLGVESRNGYGYTSCYFSSIGGELGAVSIQPSAASTIRAVVTLGVLNTAVGNILTKDGLPADVSVIAGDPGGSHSSAIGTIKASNVRVVAGASVDVGSVYTSGDLLVADQESTINKVRIDGSITQCAGRIMSGLVEGDVYINSFGRVSNLNVTGSLYINNNFSRNTYTNFCRIAGGVTVLASSLSTSFMNMCTVLGPLVGVANAALVLNDCALSSVNVNFEGMSTRVIGGSCAALAMGVRTLLYPAPTVASLSGWLDPTSATSSSIGAKTQNPLTGKMWFRNSSGAWLSLTPS